jgi:hypothetical protein
VTDDRRRARDPGHWQRVYSDSWVVEWMVAMNDDELRLKIAKLKGVDKLEHLPETYYERAFIDDDGRPDGVDGWECPRCHANMSDPLCCPSWPRDIAAAWGLVEEVQEYGMSVCVQTEFSQYSCFISKYPNSPIPYTAYKAIDTLADTAPRAICLAWLKWKEAQS